MRVYNSKSFKTQTTNKLTTCLAAAFLTPLQYTFMKFIYELSVYLPFPARLHKTEIC